VPVNLVGVFLADLLFPLEDLGRFRGRVSVYWP
jgi:hypothetical protein